MQHISSAECSKWLQARNITESPYAVKGGCKGIYYGQKLISEDGKRVEPLFTQSLIEKASEQKQSLLVFTDWDFYNTEDWEYYKPYQLTFVEILKGAAITSASTMDKGLGFLYEPNDIQDLVSHLKISCGLGWTVYFYSGTGKVTMLFWEGSIIDVWARSKKTLNAIKAIMGIPIVRLFPLRLRFSNKTH